MPQLRRFILIVVAASGLLSGGVTRAQQASDRVRALDAQIDRIFREHAYDAPRFGPARWREQGRAYTIVERGADGRGSDIARYDAATGARTVLVAAARLTPAGAGAPLEIDDYAWSTDGRRLLISTNTRKVWRQNTRGDYWVLDTSRGSLKKIGGDAPEATLMFAKFSPDGQRVAYVRANNLYVETIEDGATVQLTRDGSETTINGTSDWVYEEELSVRDGFRWSPDGSRIAYWQFDTTGVSIFSLIDDTSALYPIVKRIPYPKAGTKNSAVRIGAVSASGGATVWLKTPGDPRDSYLATLEWVNATTVAMQQLNRQQNQDDYLLGDATTGGVRRVFRDQSKTWVDVQDAVPWIDHDGSFLWLSERDGWRHVYRIAASKSGTGDVDSEPALLTRFDGDVTEVAGVDEEHRVLYFIASPQNATERYLYRAPLDGSSAPERVTPAGQAGTHQYDVAPGGHVAFHTFSTIDRPPAMDVVALPAHSALRALTDPAPLAAKLADIVRPPTEFFTIDGGDGATLDGWMLRPTPFDASRRYPVIVYVYGEPAGVTVTNQWGGGRMLFHRALAAAGYVVASFDNRGTPAPKGAAWRKVVYGAVGDLSSKEQAAAIRGLSAKYPFIDANRIGVWGWSGGGSNTLNCMFRFPDVYKVGVSVAPVPDERLYDTIYQERYMGLPQDNADGYRLGSPITFADRLSGKLLIVHGSGDDNVHYQGTERLVNRLVELGKPFDLMVYPNRTHAIAEGPGTTPHLFHLIARYFLQNLPVEP